MSLNNKTILAAILLLDVFYSPCINPIAFFRVSHLLSAQPSQKHRPAIRHHQDWPRHRQGLVIHSSYAAGQQNSRLARTLESNGEGTNYQNWYFQILESIGRLITRIWKHPNIEHTLQSITQRVRLVASIFPFSMEWVAVVGPDTVRDGSLDFPLSFCSPGSLTPLALPPRPNLQPTQVKKATDSVFQSPLNHITSGHSNRF